MRQKLRDPAVRCFSSEVTEGMAARSNDVKSSRLIPSMSMTLAKARSPEVAGHVKGSWIRPRKLRRCISQCALATCSCAPPPAWICSSQLVLPLRAPAVAALVSFAMFSQRNRELHKAIQQGDCAKVIQCLDKGPKRERADPNQVDSAGHLPLIRTVCNERLSDCTASRIVGALLDRGAYVDRRWRADNPTALYLACRENRFRTAELLLAHGAHVNFAEDQKHFTPLHIGWHGNVDVVSVVESRRGHQTGVRERLSSARCFLQGAEVAMLLFDRDLVDMPFGGREGATAWHWRAVRDTWTLSVVFYARGRHKSVASTHK